MRSDEKFAMKSQLKLFDDLAQLAGGTVGLLASFQQQIRTEIRERIDARLAKLDAVPREDFERLESMLSEARAKQAELETRLSDLENSTNSKPK